MHLWRPKADGDQRTWCGAPAAPDDARSAVALCTCRACLLTLARAASSRALALLVAGW